MLFSLMGVNQTSFYLIDSNNSCISLLYDSIERCMTLILKMFHFILKSKYFNKNAF